MSQTPHATAPVELTDEIAAQPLEPAATGPFAELADVMALPRLGGLALSADGRRLVTSVATLAPDRKTWRTALWEVDPAGQRDARQLTRSAPGESAPVFAPDGTLLFTSARPDPDAGKDAGDPKPALWALPGEGGEARLVLARKNGISAITVAAGTGDVVVVASATPGADDDEADAARRDARKDAGVTAILHESYPVRYWDHDLGPAVPRAFLVGPVAAAGSAVTWRDLTPTATPPNGAGSDVALSPDGRWLARGEEVAEDRASWRQRLVVTDTSSGETRVLVDDPAADIGSPAWSPDSTRVVCVRESGTTQADPPDYTLLVVDVATGGTTDLTAGFDRWPSAPQFDAAGTGVYFLADDDGRHALFRVLPGEQPVRLTRDGAYSELQVARDGSALYALRSAFDHPPTPVRLHPSATDQQPEPLPNPGTLDALPGTLRELHATAADGARVQSWLVLPAGASADSPAPLLLWIHGGPLMSWNSWSWRWLPWVMAAQGYAVLLPNPALSQGFGQDFVRRGWGSWGGAPYSDLMAATDAAVELPEVDGSRTAAMGGSFGGYMANWVATQTDRFDAVVTHASLWHLDGFIGATDAAYYWEKEFGDPLTAPARYEQNSPHRFADGITTPVLVIHGDKDYRVPIGEGLRLWYDLQKRGVPSKFLYFPDENHWVLTPGNAMVWYETVLAFLAEHVLGEPWSRPDLL